MILIVLEEDLEGKRPVDINISYTSNLYSPNLNFMWKK